MPRAPRFHRAQAVALARDPVLANLAWPGWSAALVAAGLLLAALFFG